MKQYKLLALTLGGAFMLNGMTATLAAADQAADITNLQQQMAEMENSLANQVQIHATASQGYLHSDSGHLMVKNPLDPYDNTSFHFNEFAFNISADVTDKLRVGMQIMSRDYGPLMNNKVYLDWAIMDYAWKDEVGLRAGRLKVPYGMYNESRDIDVARTSIFLPCGVYSEIDRINYNLVDGFGVYGAVGMGFLGSMNYQAVYGEADIEIEGITKSRGNTKYVVETEDLFSLGLSWETPLEGLKVGGTYLQSDVHISGNLDMTIYGGLSEFNDWYMEYDYYHVFLGSVEYSWNDLIVAAEYQETRVDVHDNLFGDSDSNSGGWYISTVYRFSELFAAEIYYTEYYGNMDNKNGDGLATDYTAWQKDWAFNGRFDLNDFWLVKAGVTFKDGLADTDGIDATDADADASRHWVLYQLKTTVFF